MKGCSSTVKNSNKAIQERHRQLIEFLKDLDSASVPEISLALDASEVTIRRDLITLSKKGLVTKFHGGAKIIAPKIAYDQPNDQIEVIKHALAKKAAEFVKEDQTLFLNTSSTALLSLRYIEDKRVNVITNNVKAASIEHDPRTTIILSGGEIRFPKEALVGDIAVDSFSKMIADISIIGCSGVSPEEGITTPIVHEAKINSMIIERTKGLKIVVADYRKIGTISNFLSSQMTNITYLITDNFADPVVLNAIEKMGVAIIQVTI